MRITEQDIFDALEQATKGPDDALTSEQLMKLTGAGYKRIRKGLKALKAQGRLEVYRIKAEAVDGVMRYTNAYRITPKGE